jgi:hypothetical protein
MSQNSNRLILVVFIRLLILAAIAIALCIVLSRSTESRKTETTSPPKLELKGAPETPATTTQSSQTTESPAATRFYEAENGCSYMVIAGSEGKPDLLIHSELCPRCSALKQ